LPVSLLLPAVIATVVLVVFPICLAVDASLREGFGLDFSSMGDLPLGLANYRRVFADPATWRSLSLAVVYVLGVNLPALGVGLAGALLLNRPLRARRWIRTLFVLPWVAPSVVVTIVFLWMLDASYGVANSALQSLGLVSTYPAWYFDSGLVMIGVILPTAWKSYPFFLLIILAALQTIPRDLYEAARVDGAGGRAQFHYITWPGIRNSVLLSLLLNGLWTFREFDFIYAATQGGPAGASETVAIRVYNDAFQFFQFGQAAALGVVMMLLAMLLVLLVAPMMRRSFF
jgi:multiple sugar transport system permease protein